MPFAIWRSKFVYQIWLFTGALLLVFGVACSKSGREQIVIDVPANFSGQVQIEMGVPGAPPLKSDGNGYHIAIPPDGKFSTSSVIADSSPRILHVENDHLWGYTPKVTKTGDGVAVGASIEFFVGSKEQYETAEARKHKSLLHPTPGTPLSHPS